MESVLKTNFNFLNLESRFDVCLLIITENKKLDLSAYRTSSVEGIDD